MCSRRACKFRFESQQGDIIHHRVGVVVRVSGHTLDLKYIEIVGISNILASTSKGWKEFQSDNEFKREQGVLADQANN